ncbi:anhydro-N-acetylmuramic acid kinase AnmK [Pullulanibacillus sp. KACC 23026]|uniref:anhydro-N-acetylmuramic acid kinase AnmK n=1 Tax=Pullulanibacillus sp. KACC 23026 TaxID=3028315 RepID=UPI0023B1D93D|nr:anhydro-N-acetylmuramic acid kinase AnmK [Pullulanibacillus sp. KACC 23026]WEG14936.1 anhydro-N-acetylmuramic acid kinase AnmK [Pullulanibacillus sp. KACC 23026]
MSGTSLDGVDAALVKIEEEEDSLKAKLIEFYQADMPSHLKEEIKRSMDPQTSRIDLLCSLNFKLGYWFAEAVKKVCEAANFPIEELDLVGSHGQTLYHIPKSEGNLSRSTLQLGEPSIIAYETGALVLSNFRPMDMAAGGEGAPLVPYTDYLLFRSEKYRALQNIGGISNVTVLPAFASIDDVSGSDTGPGNMIIDELCVRLLGVPFDNEGRVAAKGKVHSDLLEELLQHPFLKRKPPKSTGREDFGEAFVDQLLAKWNQRLGNNDLIATATQFTASSIAHFYENYLFPYHPIQEVIISGGGASNHTLVRMIQELLPNCRVLVQEDLGFCSQAKEAIAFAVLAYETYHKRCGNIPKATGAKERVILGQITYPPHGI